MEKTISKKYVYKGKIFNIREDEVSLPNGNTSVRNIVEHNGGCAILIYEKSDDSIFFVKQYRYAFEEEKLELPAGKIEPGEGHLSTALREAEEEVGVRPNSVEYLGVIYPTCGYSNEKIHLYYCEDYELLNKLSLDEDEFLEPIKIKLDKVCDMVLKGEIETKNLVVKVREEICKRIKKLKF